MTAGVQASPGRGQAVRAVRPVARLRAEVQVPGDKSIAHRALIFNWLADGEAKVEIVAPGADVRATADALGTLGGTIDASVAGSERVRYLVRGPGPAGLAGQSSPEVDCRNSGTTMRLLAGLASTIPLVTTLVGDESLSRRPMERVARPLGAMGALIRTTDGHAPVTVGGSRALAALDHQLPVASAQVLGAICIAALAAEGDTTITTPGPTRDHTERLLGWLGVPVIRETSTTRLRGPARPSARSLAVPGDISSAAAWLVAAAIHPDAEIRIPGTGLNPTRTAIIEVLREMGALIEVAGRAEDGPEPAGDITVRSAGRLRPVSIAGSQVARLIDELPLLGVAMAAAEGWSELRDAGELRVKESDRIAVMIANLRAIGAQVEELRDGWRVRRGTPREARIATHGDHRVAISFAVAALGGIASAVILDDPACVDVSYPTFWKHLAAMGATQ